MTLVGRDVGGIILKHCIYNVMAKIGSDVAAAGIDISESSFVSQ